MKKKYLRDEVPNEVPYTRLYILSAIAAAVSQTKEGNARKKN